MTGSEKHYPVRVPIFEGPLDLLLHLVRVNAVDITDIPILEITRQYEEYLAWRRKPAGRSLVLLHGFGTGRRRASL